MRRNEHRDGVSATLGSVRLGVLLRRSRRLAISEPEPHQRLPAVRPWAASLLATGVG